MLILPQSDIFQTLFFDENSSSGAKFHRNIDNESNLDLNSKRISTPDWAKDELPFNCLEGDTGRNIEIFVFRTKLIFVEYTGCLKSKYTL